MLPKIWENNSILVWSDEQDYPVGSLTKSDGGGGLIYTAKLASGPSSSAGPQNPSQDTTNTYWTPVSLDDNNVVHKTGDETIDGDKTFIGTLSTTGSIPAVVEHSTLLDRNANPSQTHEGWLVLLRDKNNIRYSGIHTTKYANTADSSTALLHFASNTGDTSNYARLIAGYDSKRGSTYCASNSTFYVYDSTGVYLCDPNFDGTAGKYSYCGVYGRAEASSGKTVGSLIFHSDTSNSYLVELRVNMPGTNTMNGSVALRSDTATSDKWFFPLGSESVDTLMLGSGGHKWKQLYATTSTIGTSDARLKTDPSSIPDIVLDAWEEVNFVQFQMLDAVSEKGPNARLHSGLIAQNIQSIFSSKGLDISRYGLFCHDSWEAEPDNGIAAGDQYSLRYTEALCMEAAYQRRENRRLKEKVASLEERLASLEEKLNNS